MKEKEHKDKDKHGKEKDKLKFSPHSLRIKNLDDFLVVFFRQLSEMIGAGIPIIHALSVIGTQFDDKNVKLLMDAMRYYLSGKGVSIYKTMSEFPFIFSPVWTAAVKASEDGGFIVGGLKKIADEVEKERVFKKKFYSVITYPIFIVVVSMASLIVILKFVFPSLMPISKAMNADVPATTKILVFFVAVINSPITWIVVFLIGFLFYKFVKTRKGRELFENILLELPIIGPVLRYKTVVRFSRTYSLLTESGLSMIQILELLTIALDSPHHERIFKEIKKEVENGDLLSDALQKWKIFPRIVISMIKIGEESGNMKLVLQKLAYFYEVELEDIMDKFFSMLEPILLIFMGLLVGFIVLSIFLPVYEIMSKVG